MQKATSKNLKNLSEKWGSRKVENPNVPFSSQELKEHFDLTTGRGEIMNTSPNRKARRHTEDNPMIVNCRKQNDARKSHNVLNKMSYFYLRVQGYKMGIKTDRDANGGLNFSQPYVAPQVQPIAQA
jgi:hypothetical protein